MSEHAEVRRPPSGEPPLTVEMRAQRGAIVVAVRGAVDTLTAPRFSAAMNGALHAAAARRVVVDLRGVTHLGSAGLTALDHAARQAKRRREPLRIVVEHNQCVRPPIQITERDEVLIVCHDLDEALTI
ncbi:hypothetical protein GCM10023321_72760 [Pseudonocardia eucalypti]|uniref:STAS domain-containing protein n=1 Tax=Pseudonocardia eucalypti TaxID=648755 RepID=A0ABP9R756_9PSEU|nr:anti-anti-sigma factor [Pseudonocardia eucalypti]